MFKCNVCKKSSRSGESCTRVVVEVRNVVHPKREWANDPGGTGTQIVSEAKVCPRCVPTMGAR